jgi:N-glycosidase YbiA
LVLPVPTSGVAIAITVSDSALSMQSPMTTIYFYKVDRPYGHFSNFSPHAIELDGQHWPTVEHYYQAQKFLGSEMEYLIPKVRSAPTPELAAAIGREPHHFPSTDWPQRKLAVMEKALCQKFTAHLDLLQFLLDTGTAIIIEDSPVDYFWGCGLDRSGSNHLGRILMQIRTENASS